MSLSGRIVNIFYMREFFLAYRDQPKVQPLVAQSGWSHNLNLPDLPKPAERTERPAPEPAANREAAGGCIVIERVRDIHTELADLNKEGAELAAKIQKNCKEVGA
jgi:hypothetical protein